VIAVLGYSPRRSGRLHRVCSARVDRASVIAREGDVVVLSGWSRDRDGETEAALMARAWNGPAVELVTETDARHTAGNAAAVAQVARASAAADLVLVTSWWHSPRATALLRAALRGSSVRVTAVRAPSQPSPGLLLRELACLAALPVQLLALRRVTRDERLA
jgi:uncharacterized SAM-binding protein YcdF (DUF218 family)